MRVCERMHARAEFPVLCPARLPRATLGFCLGASPPRLRGDIAGNVRNPKLDQRLLDRASGRRRMPPTRRAVALALSATAVLLAACSGGDDAPSQAEPTAPETKPSPVEAATTVEGRRTAGCPSVRAWRRGLPPREFFPPSRAGLWLRGDGCVYLVFPGREEARPLWRTPAGERELGLSWGPDGRTFALTTGSRVVLLGRDGSLLRRVRATGAAFLRDGRLAVSRPNGIYLLTGSRWRRLASRQELERVAGFRARQSHSVSHDPRGSTRGHGRGAVALTLWSAGRSWKSAWKSVVLVVSATGRVVRASPAYRAGGGEGVVSGWAWSPDGRELFVAAEVAGPPARRRRGRHDHCLDVWSAEGGRRRAFCESQLPPAHHLHFAKLAWAADGETALLDNGTIITRDGEVAGRGPVAHGDLWFLLQWEPHRG